MINSITKFFLFVSSYLPLLFIFYLQNLKENLLLSIIFIGLALASLCWLVFFIKYVETTSPIEEKIVNVQRKDNEVIAYIFTYIFPFLNFNFGDALYLVSLGIFFVILGILYVNSNMICINPTLNIIGYHLYEVETPSGSIHTLLSRRKRLTKNQSIQIITIGDDIMMEKSV